MVKNFKHTVILGKLETKFLAPFEDEDCTIITMNEHEDSYVIPRIDYWFDIHEEPTREEADYTKDNFPFEECEKLVHGKRFVTTTAYLIAYAILQGATKISLYGMRFTDDGNPRRQRELHNVREMLFFCMGRGIEIEICEEDVEYLFPQHIPDDGVDFDQ